MIHHYGRTAIPNIVAKPTVDILIGVETSFDNEAMKVAFDDIGYLYSSYGKPPAMLFVKSYTDHGFAQKVFHVHVFYEGAQDELIFRDYLIANPEISTAYEELKTELKDKYEFDRDAYTNSKSKFIFPFEIFETSKI